jgi:phosphate starvation-inducible PhoH-like protein
LLLKLSKVKVPHNIEMIYLLGQHDALLRKVQDYFMVEISIVEDELWIRGADEERISKAESFFLEMISAVHNKHYPDQMEIEYLLTRSNVKENKEENNKTFSTVVKEKKTFLKRVNVRAKTSGQARYMEIMKENDIVFSIGPAGTGKTYLAVAMAVEALKNNEVKRIVLTRPAVEAGESLGFLPGSLVEKVDPYLRPLFDAMYDMITPEKFQYLRDQNIIEIAPLAYMRGRTLNNSFIILDEAQNTTIQQMKMFLTRTGFYSKVVITGDVTQIDLKPGQKSGLLHSQNILNNIAGIAFAYLGKNDVVRHPLVKEIINAYEQAEKSNNKSQR